MMLRWEQLHAVNAVQIAWLRRTVFTDALCAAATRVLSRFSRDASARRCVRPPFEFQHRQLGADWRTMLENAVTNELNRPYDRAEAPWRLMLFETPGYGQLLGLGYRHVIADARSVVLVLHDILRQTLSATTGSTGLEAEFRSETLRQMYPDEFRWRRIPSMIWNHFTELWGSRRAFRPPCDDAGDMRMEFRIHDTALPLAAVKAAARRYDATVNDLVFASLLEWLAHRFPVSRRGRRPELAVATLADLTGRSAPPLPRAFGQFLSQFAIRVPVTTEMPFNEIVRHVARRCDRAKQIGALIDQARGFDTIARLWDWAPFLRRPALLPALIPLLAGVSNVHLGAICQDSLAQSAIHTYWRGTCITNLVPMMLSLTTVGDSCTLTTTHRPAVFTSADMSTLVAHLSQRLASSRRASLPVAA